MSNEIIKRHNFDAAKERIKNYSQQRVAELKIDSVSYCGTSFFGDLFGTDHNVTGSEFNSRIKAIREYLIMLNDRNNNNIKEFREVYNALESLDKEYIAGILISIESVKETNSSLKEKQKQIDGLVEKLQVLTDSHNKTIEDHSKLIKNNNIIMKSFIDFREKVKSSLYDDGEILNLKLINKEVNKQKDYINSLDIILSDILKNNHLKDIDEIWNYYVTSYNQIGIIKTQISSIEAMILELDNKISKTIEEFNTLNNTFYNQVGIIKNQISSIEAMILELDNKINKTIEEFNILNNTFDDKQEQFNEIMQNKEKEYDSKIRRANIIAGLSLLLAIISIGLNYI